MAQDTVPDYLSVIKQQIISQELLFEYHSKVEAMVEMVMAKDLVDYPMEKMHDYLWVISDLMIKAKVLNEELLNQLIRMTADNC